MSELILTIVLAFILVALAALGFAISYLVTGKNRTIVKRCGNPEKNKSKCDVCGNTKCTKKRDSQ